MSTRSLPPRIKQKRGFPFLTSIQAICIQRLKKPLLSPSKFRGILRIHLSTILPHFSSERKMHTAFEAIQKLSRVEFKACLFLNSYFRRRHLRQFEDASAQFWHWDKRLAPNKRLVGASAAEATCVLSTSFYPLRNVKKAASLFYHDRDRRHLKRVVQCPALRTIAKPNLLILHQSLIYLVYSIIFTWYRG